jgi:hypothetical protein
MAFGFFRSKKQSLPQPAPDYSMQISELSGNSRKADLTVILNIWKRKHLEEQLLHILNQTVLPAEIWIIHYEHHVDIAPVVERCREKFPAIQMINSDKNLKYFGRFSIAINVTTTFVWLLDDDVIPGQQWIENSVAKCEELQSIITCTGRIIPKNDYRPERWRFGSHYRHFIGDSTKGKDLNYCEEDTRVDYGCNSYFFKAAWLKAYWSVWPVTFLSGEDIHLSATCMRELGVKTTVLQQLTQEDTGNIKRPYGWDDNASWKNNSFLDYREQVFRYHIDQRGWKPIDWS